MEKIKAWAKNLKKQTFVLYFAYKDARVPWYAKVFAACVVAYAFSPIDLVPDFIPLLGYLDDIILVPLGIKIALKMIPKSVIIDCQIKAEKRMHNGKPKNWIVASLIVLLWFIIFLWMMSMVFHFLNK